MPNLSQSDYDHLMATRGKGNAQAAEMGKPRQHGGRGLRKSPGEMNTTEAKYAELLARQKLAGEIIWFGFESITFRLADRTTYTPDFAVMDKDLNLCFLEVKGSTKDKRSGKRKAWIEEDAKVKIKCAAEFFPLRFSVVWLEPGGVWRRKDYWQADRAFVDGGSNQ